MATDLNSIAADKKAQEFLDPIFMDTWEKYVSNCLSVREEMSKVNVHNGHHVVIMDLHR